jgi:hypothetical protein
MSTPKVEYRQLTLCIQFIGIMPLFQYIKIKIKKIVSQSRTGLQIYEGHDDQLNRPGPMA